MPARPRHSPLKRLRRSSKANVEERKPVFSNSAKKELENLPQDLKAIFLMHLEKIHAKSPRKHMKYGIPAIQKK